MSKSLTLLFFVIFSISCDKQPEYHTDAMLSMGTVVEITLPSAALEYLPQLKLLISTLSNTIADDCARISGSNGFVQISQHTYSLLQAGNTYKQISNNRFDSAIATITTLYGFPDNEKLIPTDQEIQSAMQLLARKKIELKQVDNNYFAAGNGLTVELGAIAKGWIVDQGSKFLKSNNVNSFIINAGGDMYAAGGKSQSLHWKVGIKDPNNKQPYIVAVNLKDKALATSGIYERYFIAEDGRLVSHIFDAKSGDTCNRYKSISVIADSAELADALATVYFLVEQEQLEEMCIKHNTSVFVILPDGSQAKYCGWETYEK